MTNADFQKTILAELASIRAQVEELKAEVRQINQDKAWGWGVLKGWDEIDSYMGTKRGRMSRMYGPELKAAGVVHKRKEGPYQTNYAYAIRTLLDVWVALRGQKGLRI